MRHPDFRLSNYSLIILVISLNFSSAISRNILSRGSSLAVENYEKDLLVSPDKTFTCGFYGSGANAFWLAIWFTNSKDRTVVWTANREKPVNGRGSRVTLQGNGVMALIDVDGTIAWETNTTSKDIREAALLDSGNLVLKGPNGEIRWQSFDYPTDTLLPTQLLTKRNKLVSSLKRGTFFSGYFNLYFDNDNVLRLIYDGPEISSLYWPNPDGNPFMNGRTTYNSSRIAVLDKSGSFLSSDRFHFFASDWGLGVKRRLTMDPDGNLRLYSLNETDGSWKVSWEAMADLCRVHGLCGRNGICVYTPNPKCSCPPGYEMNDPSDWNKGCKAVFDFNLTCSNRTDRVMFAEVMHTDYYGFDLIYIQGSSFSSCRNACLADCNCLGFGYRFTGERLCFGKSILFNGFKSTDFQGNVYLKLPVSLGIPKKSLLNGTDVTCPSGQNIFMAGSPSMYSTIVKRVRWAYLYLFAAIIGVVEIIFFITGWCILFRKTGHDLENDGYRALSSQFKRFRYVELKMATRNFKEEIGRGSSGTVYKGSLSDGRSVAVKRLGDVYGTGEEFFWAEVSTIGRINHMNLVRMWGFCSEGKKRLLVYEFIENKSLDKHLFHANFLKWEYRFKVTLGTAKGLAYLHHECLEWVIHCDVKPENILLGVDFEPKIADFGLSKLLQRGDAGSEFSRIRGTKGYMAPEWALNLPITAKVDVFSYGVMILELVRGIRLSNWVVKGDSEEEEDQVAELTRFIKVIRNKIDQCGNDSWIDEVMDPRLRGQYSKKQAKAMVEIGISCVEEDRAKRPTMDSIVDILLECDESSRTTVPGEETTMVQ